ncbi:YafY family transcriptional regulator [Maribacter litopenaei]|uniref:YafY family transcriptional regulator n=1 Tax=Maribacter litopenaei TaxID=2976127 RepID=A0ABY5YC96_9FLAO|nr:YafY family protein [Maribacter litopenaei]UWX56667.1 YafY family transcriptional regulator [Maribacter litopenaei]
MGMDTVKRFDRIVAIFIQLQSKRIVRAQDLADRFQVSQRIIYRDIRTLEASGVPISSEAGVGYSIMEGYSLPPVMFTREEAGSFVAAEKLMQQFTDKSLGAYYESAMFKVKSVLRGREKKWVEALESQVSIFPNQPLFNANIPDALEILFESIAEKKQVFLKYTALEADMPSERTIEPIGVFNENTYWYVMGYCHLRKDYRQFRTDRILKITGTQNPFVQDHKTLDELRKQNEVRDKTKVRILVDRKISKYLGGSKRHQGFVSETIKGNQVEMTFMVDDVQNYFSRWFLSFGDYAQILEPESLKKRVSEILLQTQEGLK